ncbi:MAG TPA: histidinol dehydrogenase, partial [Cytophagales bacterium]|nr:histidinol dehydrogenase [Cytophagales bacterium]
EWGPHLQRPVQEMKEIKKVVKPILKKVARKGDKALREYAAEFDHAELTELRVTNREFLEADAQVPLDLKQAITTAKANIEAFHRAQTQQELTVETMPGVICRRRSVAIEKVGLYIPGGTAPLFSTVLMLGIPAQIAGCKEIVLCTPSNEKGEVNPVILFTAKLIGIDRVVKVGGAQAIAAMAYGTESVPQVYKIFGPGNQYVTAAKMLVSQQGTAIDMPAGPSEVAVFADATANPEFVAADLLSQAEHGYDSQVVLVTNHEPLLEGVTKALETQLETLPRKEMAQGSLDNSVAFLVKDIPQAIHLLNDYGAEHLILATEEADAMSEKIVNAGSIFLGHYTPESAGDYASGTNHTLPTNGFAKMYSGVSLDSFVKKITYQRLSEQGLRNLGPSVEVMAEAEELMAHKNAVSVRLQSLA